MHQNERAGVVVETIAMIWIRERVSAVLHDAFGVGQPLDRGEAGIKRR
jgi:hypothetical protein